MPVEEASDRLHRAAGDDDGPRLTHHLREVDGRVEQQELQARLADEVCNGEGPRGLQRGRTTRSAMGKDHEVCNGEGP